MIIVQAWMDYVSMAIARLSVFIREEELKLGRMHRAKRATATAKESRDDGHGEKEGRRKGTIRA